MFKIKNQYAHGGDVQCYSINKLPSNARKLTNTDELIIARGETSGHAHILTGDVEMFEAEGQIFARVGKNGAFHQHIIETEITPETFRINKNISNADHTKECPIEEGIYAIGLDRQYDPHSEMWIKNPD